MSFAELTGSFSNIKIGDAQRKLESTPSDLIPLPQASGAFVVDKNVQKGTTSIVTSVRLNDKTSYPTFSNPYQALANVNLS